MVTLRNVGKIFTFLCCVNAGNLWAGESCHSYLEMEDEKDEEPIPMTATVEAMRSFFITNRRIEWSELRRKSANKVRQRFADLVQNIIPNPKIAAYEADQYLKELLFSPQLRVNELFLLYLKAFRSEPSIGVLFERMFLDATAVPSFYYEDSGMIKRWKDIVSFYEQEEKKPGFHPVRERQLFQNKYEKLTQLEKEIFLAMQSYSEVRERVTVSLFEKRRELPDYELVCDVAFLPSQCTSEAEVLAVEAKDPEDLRLLAKCKSLREQTLELILKWAQSSGQELALQNYMTVAQQYLGN